MANMTDIYWMEQSESDVPSANDWLSSSELLRLSNLRFPKRRSDWRLGRWTAKRALATCLNLAGDRQTLVRIEVSAAPSGAPEVFIDGKPSNFTISLSHSAGRAIAAVVLADVALGCDLEKIESRTNAFVSDYFDAEEQALIGRSKPAVRPLLATLIWSAKESALKALHAGLRLDTRSVCVNINDINPAYQVWCPLKVHHHDQIVHGWWRQTDDFIQTVVADPQPSAPVLIWIRALSLPDAAR